MNVYKFLKDCFTPKTRINPSSYGLGYEAGFEAGYRAAALAERCTLESLLRHIEREPEKAQTTVKSLLKISSAA